MADQKDSVSEVEGGEDVPSNFFDDFDKEEFMEGLEVIDSLHEEEGDGKEEKPQSHRRSYSSSRLDEYIKPGSRRDPEKTNAAIRRDKEVKVKEHLAKHLESIDELRPPGTELDDFFDVARPSKVKKMSPKYEEVREVRWSRPKEQEYQDSARRRSPLRIPQWRENRGHWHNSWRGARHMSQYGPRRGIRYSPRHRQRHSPERSSRFSPRRSPRHIIRRSSQHSSRRSPRNSPHRSPRHSPRRSLKRSSRRSPRNGTQNSPRYSSQRSPRRSPHRSSRHSPLRERRSPQRSPRKSSQRTIKHSPHWSPRNSPQHVSSQSFNLHESQQFFQLQYNPEIPTVNEPYTYSYTGAYSTYTPQPGPPVMPMPQPVQPCPINPVPPPIINHINPHPNYMIPEPVPMVPPPTMVSPIVPLQPQAAQHVADVKAPYDALAQLVADGKLSKEDYLKLTPSIKGGNNVMDDKTRIGVLSRCNQAVKQLNNLSVPNRFSIKNSLYSNETPSLRQKYCSPLKRQVPVVFEFTKEESQKSNLNKQLINNIVATIGLEKALSRTKLIKDMNSVGVQTSKPYCDMCEIRDSTKTCSVGTSTDPEFFTSTVHTQVVEQDLINSKAIFNPRGSVGDGAPISIAHLTPAQLVSQLAARAKTFQHSESPPATNQFVRRNPPNPYDDRGGAQHFNQNYRYRY